MSKKATKPTDREVAKIARFMDKVRVGELVFFHVASKSCGYDGCSTEATSLMVIRSKDESYVGLELCKRHRAAANDAIGKRMPFWFRRKYNIAWYGPRDVFKIATRSKQER